MLDISKPNVNSTSPTKRWALWNLGFRPLYLLAGGFATIAMAYWVACVAGWAGDTSFLRDPLWHAHEMIFGSVQIHWINAQCEEINTLSPFPEQSVQKYTTVE